MDLTFLDNKYLLAIGSAAGGVLLTLLTEQILSKRGRFTYFVQHFRVGMSADDPVFGSVRVTWNEEAVASLYSSTVELVNESMKDFENVVVKAFTNGSNLLTEKTEIVGTASTANWTDDFRKRLDVAPGQAPSKEQKVLYLRQREYLLPVVNRGQIIRFHFLNASQNGNEPSIWLDIIHKGVKLKFQVRQNQVCGVAQPRAALAGAILGFALLGLIVPHVNSVWIAALSSLLYGFMAQLPGAWLVRTWRWLRQSLGG